VLADDASHYLHAPSSAAVASNGATALRNRLLASPAAGFRGRVAIVPYYAWDEASAGGTAERQGLLLELLCAAADAAEAEAAKGKPGDGPRPESSKARPKGDGPRLKKGAGAGAGASAENRAPIADAETARLEAEMALRKARRVEAS
jgi:hypothetical protein